MKGSIFTSACVLTAIAMLLLIAPGAPAQVSKQVVFSGMGQFTYTSANPPESISDSGSGAKGNPPTPTTASAMAQCTSIV